MLLGKALRAARRRLGAASPLARGNTASKAATGADSRDETPWNHPFLTTRRLEAFRAYSEEIWEFALHRASQSPRVLRVAFGINLAQNMYKWAAIARRHGAEAALFLNTMDQTALSAPEWEEFDGEYADLFDGAGFLASNPGIALEVPVQRIPLGDSGLLTAAERFEAGERRPLLELLATAEGIRHEVLLGHPGFYPYFAWARAMADFDVVYCANTPFAAYASGRPYCATALGADLRLDCGRADAHGRAMALSFNAARFLTISNPHVLAHSRRLGFTNGVYLPYPMNSDRYCPGTGTARGDWQARHGGSIFVLCTARIDRAVKGQSHALYDALAGLLRDHPELRFVFIAWGTDAQAFQARVGKDGLAGRFILLPPVGKRRLIDYYRSCDIVLDQMVYGYLGATALEAASVGKPIVMRLRSDHYAPLYRGDIPPVVNAGTPDEVRAGLNALVADRITRERHGQAMREWLVRNHGEHKTGPLMLALLRLAADRASVPNGVRNPLHEPITPEEQAYHAACLHERR